MMQPKMMILFMGIVGLTYASDFLNEYGLSYMEMSTMLCLMVLLMCIVYFYNKLFTNIWGCFSALVVFVPAIAALFNQNVNYNAVMFDMVVTLILIGFFGYKLLKQIDIKRYIQGVSKYKSHDLE